MNDPKAERWRNIDDEDVYTNRITDENPLRPLEFKEESTPAPVNEPPVREEPPVAQPDEQPVTQAELAEEQMQMVGADPRDFNRVQRETPVKQYGPVKKGTSNPDIFIGAYYSRTPTALC